MARTATSTATAVQNSGRFTFQTRASFPRSSELRRDRTTGRLEDPAYHETESVPGVLVYRFDAPLMFANAAAFGSAARELADRADPPAKLLVVDCEEMFETDFTGAEALGDLVLDIRARGMDIRLARVHSGVLSKLRDSGVIAQIGEENVFTQIADAVRTP